jgi:hypothetical protein
MEINRDKIENPQLFTVAETLTRDIWCQEVVTTLHTPQYVGVFCLYGRSVCLGLFQR